MALIKSISGIRGTIGGKPGVNLTPLDIIKYTAAYAEWLRTTGLPPIVPRIPEILFISATIF